MKKTPRIIIAGTSSGSGKTTTVCGLLGILKNRGLQTISYKCGPDYIDPMFHSKVIGIESYNLDLFFKEKNEINTLLHRNCADISVIEGVMGFYDGVTICSEIGSTHDLSKVTDTPVILVINCKGMANSVLAILKGFYTFKQNNIKGVILNNVKKNTYTELKKGIEQEFLNKITVLGYIAKLPQELILESRHLGLKTANEIDDIKEKLNKISNILSETLDIDAIIKISNEVCETEFNDEKIEQKYENVNIAVAYDNAFCFYYKETFEILEKLGAKITFFSPLNDEKLPDDIDGLYLGGGYPELYAQKLSENNSMKNSIFKALSKEIPCIAECGGFMYLNEKIDDFPMVGFINGNCENKNKLVRFGYVSLTAKNDNLLCKKGESFKGHEFHYYDSSNNGDSILAEKISGISWEAAHTNEHLYAGFPHIAFNRKIAENFIKKCIEGKENVKY